MITALCFRVGLGILARFSQPKRAYMPPRETVTSIIFGAIGRMVLIFVIVGFALFLFAAMI